MSEAGFVIGLDLGTSGVKAVAVDARGQVVRSAQRGVTLVTDDGGKAEQSVEEVWKAAQEVLGEVMSADSGRPDPLKRVTPCMGICVSGAMHSLVAVDEEGNVLGDATTWADQRCARIATEMRDTFDVAGMYQRTGCAFSALYHPARLRWWAQAQAGAGAGAMNCPRRVRFAAIKDVIIARLTGRGCTDASLASTTGLMDTRTWRWDGQAMELAGIVAGQLPEIVAPTEVVGTTAQGVPVIAGASDGAMANVGAAGFDSDATVITLGTSGAVRRMVREPRIDPARRTWCYVVERDRWLHGGAINSGGIAVQHAIEQTFGKGEKAIQQAHAEAGEISVGCEGLMVLPFVTGERGLIWPAEAKWVEIGRSAKHGPGHLVRATMEGVAYCMAGLWEALESKPDPLKRVAPGEPGEPGEPGAALLTGGVVRSRVWRQIMADVLGVAMQPVEAADASAVGAALLGWRALGVSVDPPPCAGDAIVPDPARHAKYGELMQAFQASCRVRSWM